MALYFLPNHEKITTEEQRNIFEIRNRMVPIPSNFPKIEKKEICVCGELENSKHIYQCKVWSENDNEKPTYENIFTDDISEQIQVNKEFQKNYQRREKYKLETKNKEEIKPHVIQISDPLSSSFEYGNG